MCVVQVLLKYVFHASIVAYIILLGWGSLACLGLLAASLIKGNGPLSCYTINSLLSKFIL